MRKYKFEIGQRVMINPLAKEREFRINSCSTSFMQQLDEEFEIKRRDKRTNDCSVYEINGWWIREVCIIPAKEVNEI